MSSSLKRLVRWLPVLLAVTITTLWLTFAPDGLLGKADAVGYAICHRLDERSFHIGERQVPMCARCSGMYLGALLGLAWQWRQGRKGKLPPIKFLAVLVVFLLAFGVDGLNSYLHFFPGAPTLYTTTNFIRLVTGTGMGLSVALVFLPVFHQSIWLEFEDAPALHSWRQLAGLVALAAGLVALVYSENLLLLYPLALLSAAGVLLLLTLCYTMLWTFAFNKDNTARITADLLPRLLLGFSTAILQMLLIDAVRLWFTHTWGGFNLG